MGPQGPAGENATGTPFNRPDSLVQRNSSGGFEAGAISVSTLVVRAGGILSLDSIGPSPSPPSGTGTRLVWVPDRYAFRAGRIDGTDGGDPTAWDSGNLGFGSAAFGTNTMATHQGTFAAGTNARATNTNATAFGVNTLASGNRSFAAGGSAVSSGDASVSIGDNTVASGAGSTAIGYYGQASGPASLALGDHSVASGGASIAMGYQATVSVNDAIAIGAGAIASGVASIAIGNASTAGRSGSIAIGDQSADTPVEATAQNQFVVRAAGGTRIYSSDTSLEIGVELRPGESGWYVISDKNRKQEFRALDGNQVLARIRTMPIQEWSYIGSGPRARHVGPTAQDFRAAFGLGTSDLSINTVDIDGINLFAIQQLIERYEMLKSEHEALRNEVSDLRARLERLERLERLLEERNP